MNEENSIEQLRLRAEELSKQMHSIVSEIRAAGYQVSINPDATLYVYKTGVLEAFGENKHAVNSKG